MHTVSANRMVGSQFTVLVKIRNTSLLDLKNLFIWFDFLGLKDFGLLYFILSLSASHLGRLPGYYTEVRGRQLTDFYTMLRRFP